MSDTDRLPVINVWNHILVPLQGEISDAIAEKLVDQVLETIRDAGAEGLIIDLTGIWMVDSHLCSVLSRLAASARLMGAHSIMCGMNAQVAITLQTMGIDMEVVRTALTLEEAFKSLGIGRLEKKRTTKGVRGGGRDRDDSRAGDERDESRRRDDGLGTGHDRGQMQGDS
ncbi:MAG TPA: STAS domain-containing protein [Labilithrix sp.]|nr:STAS domain-containing protein [Labilithrix sp.]